MADTDLTITFKSEHKARIFDAFDAYAGKSIEIRLDENNMSGEWQFTYDVKGTGETNAEYGERVIKEFIRAVVRCYEYQTDTDRYNGEVDGLDEISQSVPDGIVE